MKKVIQDKAGLHTVDSKKADEKKYFNAEELAMKFCEDCKAFSPTSTAKGTMEMVEPKIEYREIEKPVIVEKLVYVDKPIVVEKPIYKEVKIPVITEKIVYVDKPVMTEKTVIREVKVPITPEIKAKKWWEFWK